jgi:hypothetical protein
MCRTPVAVLALMLVASVGAGAAPATSEPAPLLAGTGKVSIDPPASMLPIRNFRDSPLIGIHDSLYARALALRQGATTAFIVVSDLIILPDEIYEKVLARLTAKYGVPRERILLSVTHVHTVPWTIEGSYGELAVEGMLAAVDEAMRRLEPVRVGRGNGQAFINMNRDERLGGGFILGQDPEGPSDKTVRVVGFFRGDSSPVAIFANYAVHAVSLYSSDTAGEHAALVSADIPGVVDRFADAHYGAERTTTFWTSGAAGDQNPILMSYHAEPQSDGKVVPSDMKAAGFAVTERLGQALALEVIRVTDRLTPAAVTAPLRAGTATVRCALKTDPSAFRTLTVSYLGIGPVDLIGISGEVGTLIDRRLRTELGARDPIVLTLTNGYSGYLPDDASYARGDTFEVTKTSFAAGCAEAAIVHQARALLGEAPP